MATGRKFLIRNNSVPLGLISLESLNKEGNPQTIMIPAVTQLMDLTHFSPLDRLLRNSALKGLIDQGKIVLFNADEFTDADWGDNGSITPPDPDPDLPELPEFTFNNGGLGAVVYDEAFELLGAISPNAVVTFGSAAAKCDNSGNFHLKWDGENPEAGTIRNLVAVKEGFKSRTTGVMTIEMRAPTAPASIDDFEALGIAVVRGEPGSSVYVMNSNPRVPIGVLDSTGQRQVDTKNFAYTNGTNEGLHIRLTKDGVRSQNVFKVGFQLMPVVDSITGYSESVAHVKMSPLAQVKVGTVSYLSDRDGDLYINEVTGSGVMLEIGSEDGIYSQAGVPLEVTLLFTKATIDDLTINRPNYTITAVGQGLPSSVPIDATLTQHRANGTQAISNYTLDALTSSFTFAPMVGAVRFDVVLEADGRAESTDTFLLVDVAQEPLDQTGIAVDYGVYPDTTTFTGTAQPNGLITFAGYSTTTDEDGKFEFENVDLTALTQFVLLSKVQGYEDHSQVIPVLPLLSDLTIAADAFPAKGTVHVTGTEGMEVYINSVMIGLMPAGGSMDIPTAPFYQDGENIDLVFEGKKLHSASATTTRKGTKIPAIFPTPAGGDIQPDTAPYVVRTSAFATVRINGETAQANSQGNAVFNMPVQSMPIVMSVGTASDIYVEDAVDMPLPARKAIPVMDSASAGDTSISGKLYGQFNVDIQPMVIVQYGGTGYPTNISPDGSFVTSTTLPALVAGNSVVIQVRPRQESEYEDQDQTFAVGS